MPSGSLNRMSVPATNDGAGNGALLMPKLQYRFRILFINFGVDTSTPLTKQVIDVGRPQIAFENIVLDVYNSKINIAGKHSWEPVTVNLREDVSGEVQKLVGQQMQKQFDFYEQSQAAAGQNYKFQTKIEVLDGGNGSEFESESILETFELYGCYIENVNYNTLNYATSEPVTISLTIRYDNAIQTDIGTGIGSSVGKLFGNATSSILSTGNAS